MSAEWVRLIIGIAAALVGGAATASAFEEMRTPYVEPHSRAGRLSVAVSMWAVLVGMYTNRHLPLSFGTLALAVSVAVAGIYVVMWLLSMRAKGRD